MALGKQHIIEFYDCDKDILNSVTQIEAGMKAAALAGNASIVNATFHHFSPHGVSGVLVIKESHLTIHTWPEYNYAAVDIFTCGETINNEEIIHILKIKLKSKRIESRSILRGNLEVLKKPGKPLT